MRTLLILSIILLFSCEKEKEATPVYTRNVVFYATAGGHEVNIENIGSYYISKDSGNKYPQCTSYYDSKSRYLVLYLKEGRYRVTLSDIQDVFYVSVKAGYCNTFDVSNVYAWK